ncbi:hypothetical protein QR680_012711 [Steinernema hermaphroditum]|uniref:Uncharacterized protein n=1 Tax=Steinernema hermaphroditum TaxID=289476 RepID=A0AA39M095_9BILA|nr:hypothetical protein QR680_012711 [Steinernema hermaphroditum]
MGDDGDKIGWMYEGTKAIVNREDYLLGKKIDKNFELYSDVFEKDKDEDRLKHLEQSSVDACKGEAGTSKVSSLQIDVVRTEDPLVALKVSDLQRRREFIENPLNKLKYEKMMRKAFEEMKKAAAEAGDEKKKKSRKDKKKKKKRRDSTSSDEEPEAESKLKGWDSEESSPESHRHGRADSKSLRKEEQKRPARRSPSEMSGGGADVGSRLPTKEGKQEPERTGKAKRENSIEGITPLLKDHDRKSRRERRRSRSASPKRQHRPSDRRRRSRSGSPEFRSRDEKKVEKKKPRLTDAEREAKRLEMMSNAKWRDDLRTKNVTMAATDDQKELDNENGKVANFIKPLVHSVTDNMTVEDKLRVKRKQLQSSHGYMDKL